MTESPESAARAPFSTLVRAELGLKDSDQAVGSRWLEIPPRQLFGLALSGGGIRSATFNLGLLQGLQERGYLRGFDYLATVSGGGYVGAFWTLWRHLHPGKVFPDDVDEAAAEPKEIRHLRKFSRFLSPSLGIFSFDTGRMLVALINAVVPSLVGAMSFLLLLLLGSIAVAVLVLVMPARIAALLPDSNGALSTGIGAFLAMIVFGTAHLLAMRAMWSEDIDRRTTAWVGVLMTVVLALLWALFVAANHGSPSAVLDAYRSLRDCRSPCGTATLLDRRLWWFALAPAGALLLLPSLGALGRVSDKGRGGRLRPVVGVIDQVNSWFMFAAAAWLGLTVLWWTAFFVFSAQGALSVTLKSLTVAGIPLAALVTWLARFVGSVNRSSESKGERLGRWAVSLGGYVVVALMAVLCMLLLIVVQQHGWWRWMFAAIGLGNVYVLLLYDPNRVGLHDFYRSRIARGYFGAAHAQGKREDDATEEQPQDDALISSLDRAGSGAAGPLHLVVCAANNLTPRDRLGSLSRGAESAVVSPVGWSVGDAWVRWPVKPAGATEPWKAEAPKLSAVVTASGAAFNTQMGSKSRLLGPAMAFVMSSLGLRLGLWLRHPRKVGIDAETVRSNRGFGLVDELLGRSDSGNGDWVFLSDGGHFDNTGLYELVRRHCRFILVSDCGADSERAFDDLGAAVRHVREDFGVDIKISLDALKPGADGLSRQPMVAGDIHYPDGDTGTLLVLKPSLTGSEPPDILQYRARNEKFPHQSTSDQFFDEAQWESYRRLGLHVARTAFASAIDRHPTLAGVLALDALEEPIESLRRRMARDFGAARREWLARPVDYTARVDRLAATVGGLDRVLADAGARLPREIFWELPRFADAGRDRSAAKHAHEDHVAALVALRQALVAFESMFLSESLSTYFNQPMYTGIMNLMARWMGAPLMRAWWPLLCATSGDAFRQFAEKQFLLGGARRDLLLTQQRKKGDVDRGLASRGRDLRRTERADVTTLRLLMVIEGEPDSALSPLQRHSVEVARLDATGSMDLDVMMWDARDLYVPPGLWGMGLGSTLLANVGSPAGVVATAQDPAMYDAIDEKPCEPWVHGCRKVVFVRSFWTGTPDEKKDSADFQQLYLDAGFTNASAELFNEPSVRAAYHGFYERWRPDAPYLLPPDRISEHVDSSDFVVLRR